MEENKKNNNVFAVDVLSAEERIITLEARVELLETIIRDMEKLINKARNRQEVTAYDVTQAITGAIPDGF